jgi:hypothetical protein
MFYNTAHCYLDPTSRTNALAYFVSFESTKKSENCVKDDAKTYARIYPAPQTTRPTSGWRDTDFPSGFLSRGKLCNGRGPSPTSSRCCPPSSGSRRCEPEPRLIIVKKSLFDQLLLVEFDKESFYSLFSSHLHIVE